MLDILQFIFTSPWTFLGTVVLLLILLCALLLICLSLNGFAPRAGQAPQTLPGRNPWAS